MKKILLFIIPILTFGQNPNRKFESFKNSNNTLEINVSDGQYLFKCYSEFIIETTFLPKGEVFIPNSHDVILSPIGGIYKISDSSNNLTMSTTAMVVVIQKSPFKISYLYKGKELLSEKNGYFKKDSTEILDFNLDKTEILYGGGARALGMNRRGNRLQLYNRASYGYETRAELMNFTMPIVMSSKIYAIHFDNTPIGYLDLDSKHDNSLQYETISGRKTYQVIAADNWEDLIDNYTSLTGKQPMPARWTLGNFSSRFGYHSQEEVERTIRKFEEYKIPVDAIILDLYWFGKTIKSTMGNLTWDKDNWPNPTKMMTDLNAKNIKTVLITEPFVLSTSSKWQEAVDKKVLAVDKSGNPAKFDFYFGNTGIIDIFKPEGKLWFWNIYKDLINQGCGGLWGDLGEPEVFPSQAITAGGKADEVHNIYGHYWAKLIQESYKKDFPNVRPFILMRAGSSGSQRFGMIPWSGDVNRSWGGLQSQTEIALQMGMQGMGYMHSDLGGFAGDYFDNELYIRWLQYGVFNPIFRPHAQEEVASEAVYKDVATREKAKTQIELRYQMLPYNYTLAFDNNQHGLPLMQSLLFEEPTNIKLATNCENYLWGHDFLVTPITKPNTKTANVYFPKKNNWYDLYSGKKYMAGTSIDVPVVEEHIPTFVRGGSFIPMIKTIQNTSQYSLSKFDLHYFFDDKNAFSFGKLYNDDGTTPNAFEKEQFEILHFESNKQNREVTLKIYTEVGKNFIGIDKNINLILHNITPKNVMIGNKNTLVQKNKSVIEIPVSLLKNGSTTIKIKY